MTYSLTLWLSYVLASAAIVWFAPRAAIPFAIIAALSLPASFLPVGTPIFWKPPSGKYTVLGARIDVNKAIYVLVDSGKGDPVYYVLPYSNQTAEQLQKAIEGARESGGRVGMQINGDGAIGIAENVPPEEPVKVGD